MESFFCYLAHHAPIPIVSIGSLRLPIRQGLQFSAPQRTQSSLEDKQKQYSDFQFSFVFSSSLRAFCGELLLIWLLR